LADEEKIGTPWSDYELDTIVADYFAMLADDLAHRPYVKSHHSAVLMAQIGRTHRSVEFKHQNISAVLEELGLPWIPGYKPMRNYQAAIFGAIDRHLSGHGVLEYQQPPPRILSVAEEGELFVAPPPGLGAVDNRPPLLTNLLRKFDPVERDFRNRTLGAAGEEFVMGVERKRLIAVERPDLARKIRWVSAEDGDGAGYDVLSYEPNGKERLIEVKTTNGAARTPFFLTRNEHEVAGSRADSWHLYRVHLFAQSPRVFTIRPPLDQALNLRAETWRATPI
jgi:hypothetical protein